MEDGSAEGLWPQRRGAQALILPRVVAPASLGTVAMMSLRLPVALFTLAGIWDYANTLGRVVPFLGGAQVGPRHAFGRLVDRGVPSVHALGSALAGPGHPSSRLGAFFLLHRRVLKELVDFLLGLVPFGSCGLRELSE